jgi:uncharacterized protein DUF4386
MSTAVMVEQIAGASPRLRARIAGALWLIIIVAASFAELFVRGRMVVNGDAAATATNILAHEPLYRLGAAAVLIYLLCDTAVALILYELLKPVSRSLSLLASFFRLAMVAILGANLLNLFAPLVLLKGAPLLTAFKADQLQALALVSLKLYTELFLIALLFFGFHCLLIGYLIYRSTFLPRIVGALMAIAGLCYLTHSFANVLSPALAARLFTYLMPLGLPGELSLTLWLLAIGVNVKRWKDQAGAAENGDPNAP